MTKRTKFSDYSAGKAISEQSRSLEEGQQQVTGLRKWSLGEEQNQGTWCQVRWVEVDHQRHC